MSLEQIYSYILENKKNWICLSGGISNDVYKLDDKYVIKIINNQNKNQIINEI